MNLIHMQGMPLFLLCWLRFLRAPQAGRGLAAAGALLIVGLTDWYYLLYTLMAAGIAGVCFWPIRDFRTAWLTRARALGWAAFLAASLATSGVLIWNFLRMMRSHDVLGGHEPQNYSLDLANWFLPGARWRFSDLTRWFWEPLPGTIAEQSAHLGVAALILAIVGIVHGWRSGQCRRTLGFWIALVTVFALFSLGPTIRFLHRPLYDGLTPYRLLGYALPFLRISGVPARMIVMSYLGLAVLAAKGIAALWLGRRPMRWLGGGLLLITLFEYLPEPFPHTPVPQPGYVRILAEQPPVGAFVDYTFDLLDGYPMFAITQHELPWVQGLLARRLRSRVKYVESLNRLAAERRFDDLVLLVNCRFFLFPHPHPERPEGGTRVQWTRLWTDGQKYLYRADPLASDGRIHAHPAHWCEFQPVIVQKLGWPDEQPLTLYIGTREDAGFIKSGFHGREKDERRRPLRWTEGDAVLALPAIGSGRPVTLSVYYSDAFVPAHLRPLPVTVFWNGRRQKTTRNLVEGPEGTLYRLDFSPPLRGFRTGNLLRLRTPAWSPADYGSTDARRLGMALYRVEWH
jgi:hypothetical protein